MKLHRLLNPTAETSGNTTPTAAAPEPAAPVPAATSTPPSVAASAAAPAQAKPTPSVIFHKVEVDFSSLAKTLSTHHILLGIVIGVASTLLIELLFHLV